MPNYVSAILNAGLVGVSAYVLSEIWDSDKYLAIGTLSVLCVNGVIGVLRHVDADLSPIDPVPEVIDEAVHNLVIPVMTIEIIGQKLGEYMFYAEGGAAGLTVGLYATDNLTEEAKAFIQIFNIGSTGYLGFQEDNNEPLYSLTACEIFNCFAVAPLAENLDLPEGDIFTLGLIAFVLLSARCL